MLLKDLNGKNVCILGFGKEGQAMFRAIEENAPEAFVRIADKNPDSIYKLIAANSPTNPTKLKNGFITQTGESWLRDLEIFDVIIKSPGIPPQPEFEVVKDKMTSATQIFFDEVMQKGAMTIGITGSKGKSTTTTLIYEILQRAGKDVHIVGNIGEPMISHIHEAKLGSIFVMELSSYQLMNVTTSPHIAVITSFFPEHLDYHGSLENYWEAKSHIAAFQTKDDVIVFNQLQEGTQKIAALSPGKHIPFSDAMSPVTLEEINLIGKHNLSNIAAATAVARELGIEEHVIVASIKLFQGLKHRLQNLGEHHGIIWIDDAISTTPDSAIAAIDALDDTLETIILGGQDRGLDVTELAKRIAASSIEHAIVFVPGSGDRMIDELKIYAPNVEIARAENMEEAVTFAKAQTAPGNICLLSTASPSYGMFKNFEEKGDLFQEQIKR